TRLSSRQSPRLGEAGLRLTPQYLRAFLGDPFAAKPGTTMPDLLNGLKEPAKAEAVDCLVHLLVSLNNGAASNAVSANPIQNLQGRLLYHQVGCVACHAPQEAALALNGKSPTTSKSDAPTSRENDSVPLGN